MKKAFVLLCALYAVDSSAMQGATRKLAAAAFATAPVTVPGAGYFAKTTTDQKNALKELEEGQDESKVLKKHDTFKSFLDGALSGGLPVVNVFWLYVLGRMQIQGEKIMTGKPQDTAWYVGLGGGLASYATTATALKWLKKVK